MRAFVAWLICAVWCFCTGFTITIVGLALGLPIGVVTVSLIALWIPSGIVAERWYFR
jgi:hypothetical protein